MVGHYAHRTEVGTLGVAIFYVLSGFLITGLLLAEHQRTGAIRLRAFYARRALRIMPAFYVFLAVAWLILHGTEAMPPRGTWWASAFYLNDYWSALNYRPSTQITHTWSLGVEEKFYLVWPLLLLLRWPKGIGPVLRLLALAIFGVWLWRALLAAAGVPMPQLTHYLQFAFESRIDYLAFGCVLAVAQYTGTWDSLTRYTAARRWLPILPIIALVALILTLGRWRWWVVSYPAEGTLISLMLFMLLAARWRWLDHRVSRYLGALSYSIYLYHMLAWYLAGQLVADPMLSRVIGAMLTLALAWLSYTFIERPALRWRDRRVPAQRAAVASRVALEAR
jgi:peptidoglycan/LPS O-acetylase OafA/YrhL